MWSQSGLQLICFGLLCRPFHVQYEDGDSEDLSWQEVLDILV